MRPIFVLGFAMVLAASCEDTTGPNPSNVPGYLISSVRLDPPVDTIFIAGTPRSSDRVTFTATAIGRNGNPLSVSAFAWSSSNRAVAIVDDAGVVTPLTTGTVEITASADKIGRATLFVLPATLTVTVTPAVDTIFIGGTTSAADTVRLQAVVRNLSGAVVGGIPLQWSSSTPSVATVTQAGLVRAVGVGVTDINVAANGHNGSARVHVIQVSPGRG